MTSDGHGTGHGRGEHQDRENALERLTEGAERVMAISTAPNIVGNDPMNDKERAMMGRVAFIGQALVRVRGPVLRNERQPAHDQGDQDHRYDLREDPSSGTDEPEPAHFTLLIHAGYLLDRLARRRGCVDVPSLRPALLHRAM